MYFFPRYGLKRIVYATFRLINLQNHLAVKHKNFTTKQTVMSSHRPSKPLFLDGEQVENHLPLPALIEAIEKCFVQYSTKVTGVTQPQRLFVPVGGSCSGDDNKVDGGDEGGEIKDNKSDGSKGEGDEGDKRKEEKVNSDSKGEGDGRFFLVKPACSIPDNTISTKLLTLYPHNERDHGLPALQSVLTIFDATTGSLRAVLDGIVVTDLRTAAASVVAVKHLSPFEMGGGEKVLTIIGGGHQAVSHVKLMRQLHGWFRETRVFIRSPHKREDFASTWNVDTNFETVEDAVHNADVVVTATSSKTPVLFHQWVKPTALVVLVGAPEPTSREADDELMLRGQVFTDSLEAAQHGGDVRLSGCTVVGELGSVVVGNGVAPKWDTVRVFKSNGMALQDLVAGKIVVDNYNEKHKQ